MGSNEKPDIGLTFVTTTKAGPTLLTTVNLCAPGGVEPSKYLLRIPVDSQVSCPECLAKNIDGVVRRDDISVGFLKNESLSEEEVGSGPLEQEHTQRVPITRVADSRTRTSSYVELFLSLVFLLLGFLVCFLVGADDGTRATKRECLKSGACHVEVDGEGQVSIEFGVQQD
jgi:hypothetical protein